MKKYPYLTLIIALLALLVASCRKDPEVNIETFEIIKEDLVVGTDKADITGVHSYEGFLRGIETCVSEVETGSIVGSFPATLNGDHFAVEITGLKKGTTYSYHYSVDYGFTQPYKTQAKRFTTESAPSLPEGVLPGVFSVSATQQVQFSQGNLQYQASTNTWRFAENQWDYVGEANTNSSPTYDGWIDLFGWGTSGYNHGAICYQPWSTNKNYSDYFAYGDDAYNLFDQTGQADWGYNAISNGGNAEHSGWRTLTHEEWSYLFNLRSTSSDIRYAKACVNNVNGVILLPDDWSSTYYTLNNTNLSGASFDDNAITASQWATLEQYGALFLTAAGRRFGVSMGSVGSCGYYWSASRYESSSAWGLYINVSYLTTDYDFGCHYGRSVRMVHNVP